MKKLIVASIAASLFLTAYGQARADSVVGIVFGTGATAPPTNWTQETTIPSGSATDLIAEDGSSSGIDLSYTAAQTVPGTTGAVGRIGDTSIVGGEIPIHTPSLETALFSGVNQEIDTVAGGEFTATLSNLTAGALYNVWVLASRDNYIDQNVAITGATTTNFAQSSGGAFDNLLINSSIGSSAQDFDSYALPIMASSTGTIEVDITGGTDGFGVSGIAISPAVVAVPLPSPAMLTLLGLGTVAIVRHRRAIINH